MGSDLVKNGEIDIWTMASVSLTYQSKCRIGCPSMMIKHGLFVTALWYDSCQLAQMTYGRTVIRPKGQHPSLASQLLMLPVVFLRSKPEEPVSCLGRAAQAKSQTKSVWVSTGSSTYVHRIKLWIEQRFERTTAFIIFISERPRSNEEGKI